MPGPTGRRRWPPPAEGAGLFFHLSSWALGLLLFAVMLGATAIGLMVGRAMRGRAESLTEPFAVLQSALLGVVGLILAFGLALAVGRYREGAAGGGRR